MSENKYLEQKNESMGENSFMKKLLQRRLNQKGLTLIELLAVIVILAIVAAIAIPAISNLIQNQRDKAVLADASSIISAAKLADAAGACDMEIAAATTNGCNGGNAEFNTYVGEVQLAGNNTTPDADAYSVVRDATTGAITVHYEAFANLSDDFDSAGITDASTSATEANLNIALD